MKEGRERRIEGREGGRERVVLWPNLETCARTPSRITVTHVTILKVLRLAIKMKTDQ